MMTEHEKAILIAAVWACQISKADACEALGLGRAKTGFRDMEFERMTREIGVKAKQIVCGQGAREAA
jgi:hypothetical protein